MDFVDFSQGYIIKVISLAFLQEINETQFNNLDYKEWHIGVVSSLLSLSFGCVILLAGLFFQRKRASHCPNFVSGPSQGRVTIAGVSSLEMFFSLSILLWWCMFCSYTLAIVRVCILTSVCTNSNHKLLFCFTRVSITGDVGPELQYSNKILTFL